MSRKALKIQMTERCLALVEKELKRHQLEKHYALRLNIILKSHRGMQNKDIALVLECDEKTVRRWRKRFWMQQEALAAYEKSEGLVPVRDKELVAKIKEGVSDSARSGAPSRISQRDMDRLVALACESPEKYGLPITNWTYGELAKQAARMGITLSSVHLGRILKKRLASTQKPLLDIPKNRG
jgi:transposase